MIGGSFSKQKTETTKIAQVGS